MRENKYALCQLIELLLKKKTHEKIKSMLLSGNKAFHFSHHLEAPNRALQRDIETSEEDE